MKNFYSSKLILKLLLAALISVFSLDLSGQTAEETESFFHSFTVGIGHTMVAKGIEAGDKKWLALPSWALDYNYRINPKWGVGIQNEIILSDFEVETFDNERVISRSKPFSSIAVLGYYPWREVMVFMGAGAEVAKEESFVLLRLGAEPAWEISERFSLVLGLTYDFKIEGYDSFGLSLGVEYKF
ncbi:hypothetical protein Oweho_0040 [Owenweeksia hongkongensis DSM 17368]|uniref:Outer membrane protein beta-barrel domain-containing protein n=1 Tax=Owenweeksia hongkongensis (strain DSM 17368 / CIP 108786 / JCM 12287 / NRRL B-23963 / UST20020801) TaxID=926562 RepID=G8R553_OWEHD|nr:hypothetical protein [Owenweeksia hongkongensis]AEV31064.1 hypothetical protein Oweho_0040 [Owenweeksia hongkongensis DSM 17368]